MHFVWGAKDLALVADANGVSIISKNGKAKRVEAERDHANKKYKFAASHPTLPFVALATTTGSIIVIDVRTGEITQRVDLDGPCAGVGLSITSIFAAQSKTGEVVEWSIEKGEEVSRITVDENGLSCLAVFQETLKTPALVASGRTELSVYSAGKRVSKYTGHASDVISVCFFKNGALASLASQERSVSIWPANVKKAKSPMLILHGTTPLSNIRAGAALQGGDDASLLACTQTGSDMIVWRLPSLNPGKSVGNLESTVSVTSGKDENILGGDFATTAGSLSILSQVKSSIQPIITTVTLLSPDAVGGIAPKIVVENASVMTQEESAENGSAKSSIKSGLKRLDQAAIVNPKNPEVEAKRLRTVSNASGGEDERPMLARLAEFAGRIDESAASSTLSAALRVGVPSSLTIALEQGLQVEDKEKIEAVLQTTDPAVVSQTVQRLPPSKVPVLVRELSARLRGKPGRASSLLIWINATLEHHITLLSSDPACREELRTLYAVADARVQTFDRLLRLRGRLDLLLSQSNPGSTTTNQANSKAPLMVIDATKL